MIDLRL